MPPAWNPLKFLFDRKGLALHALIALGLAISAFFPPVLDPTVACDLELQLEAMSDVQSRFGRIAKIEFEPKGCRRAMYGDGTSSGRYVFKISGDRSNGFVSVTWKKEKRGVEINTIYFQ